MSREDEQDGDMLRHYLTPIQPFLDDPAWTDIAINRPLELWAKGFGNWEKFAVPELTFEHLKKTATLIASYNRKTISTAKGLLSAIMPDRERVNIAIPPACIDGTISFTIRKFSDVDKSLDELEAEGAFDLVEDASKEVQPFEKELLELKAEKKIAQFLKKAIEHRRTILIVGATGSGKTFVMKSLAKAIPKERRLITIEDVNEVFLREHENKVHLIFAREDEGNNRVTAKEALAACLRMTPDIILNAELRGDEAWEFIKNVGTGHPGSITTAHANGAFEAFEQILALVKDSKTGAHLETDFIKRRLFGTIDIVLFYSQRKLREVYYDPDFKRKHLA